MYQQYVPDKSNVSVPAGALKRAFAFVLDILLIDLVIFYPFRTLFSRLVPELTFSSLERLVSSPAMQGIILWTGVSMGVTAVLYFSLLEYYTGQTVGKMIMRIRVKSEGKKLMLWQCLVRSVLLIPVFPFIVMWAADVIYLFFNSKRQRILEIMSRTATTVEEEA